MGITAVGRPRKIVDLPHDSVAAKLRRLIDRKRKGRTDAEIAEAANMSPKALSRILLGQIPNPGIETIKTILDGIGLNFCDYDKA